jgi:hypothetical protein
MSSEFILQRLVVSPVNDKGTRRKLLVGNIEFLRCCADSDSLLKQNSHESGFSHGPAMSHQEYVGAASLISGAL